MVCTVHMSKIAPKPLLYRITPQWKCFICNWACNLEYSNRICCLHDPYQIQNIVIMEYSCACKRCQSPLSGGIKSVWKTGVIQEIICTLRFKWIHWMASEYQRTLCVWISQTSSSLLQISVIAVNPNVAILRVESCTFSFPFIVKLCCLLFFYLIHIPGYF